MRLCIATFLILSAIIAMPQEDDRFTKGGLPKNRVKRISNENTLLNGVPERYHFLYQGFFANAKIDDAIIKKQLPFSSIRLTRSTCLGRCPAYDVKLPIEGMASYNGIQFSGRDGKHQAKIHLYNFARLCWAIERVKLLDDKRQSNWTIHDTSNTTLTVTMNNGDAV